MVEWNNNCCLVFFVKWQKVGCCWKILKPVFCFLLNALYPHQLLGKCCKGNKPCFKGFFSKKSQFIVIADAEKQFLKHHFSQSRVSRVSLQNETSIYCWSFDQRNRILVNSFLPWIVSSWQYTNKKSCGFCCILFQHYLCPKIINNLLGQST